jgi:hypothetical protein
LLLSLIILTDQSVAEVGYKSDEKQLEKRIQIPPDVCGFFKVFWVGFNLMDPVDRGTYLHYT